MRITAHVYFVILNFYPELVEWMIQDLFLEIDSRSSRE